MSTAPGFAIIADIGGTNARFARISPPGGSLLGIRQLRCADYPDLQQALEHYLALEDIDFSTVASVCLAVAGPIERDTVNVINNHWQFSKRELARVLGAGINVINDFTAQLLGVLDLAPRELTFLGAARPDHGQVIAALGPGTGLGVAGHTPGGEIIPSEGGHLAFAPVDEHEIAILQYLWQRFPRVSVERLLSGPGLAALYGANAVIRGESVTPLQPAEVTAAARDGDALALQSIQDFAAILGSVAGEVAIGLGARGGVYLTGGVLQHIEGLYPPDLLRERFNTKGRFSTYCSEIALALVRAEHTGLRGCAYAVLKGY